MTLLDFLKKNAVKLDALEAMVIIMLENRRQMALTLLNEVLRYFRKVCIPKNLIFVALDRKYYENDAYSVFNFMQAVNIFP